MTLTVDNTTVKDCVWHIAKAETLVRSDSFSAAKDHLFAALKHDPNAITDILVFLYKRLISFYDNLDLRCLIIDMFIHSKSFSNAIDELEDLFELCPSFSQTYPLISKVYLKIGHHDMIQQLLENAIEQQIFDPIIIDTLSKLYLEHHHIKKSIALYKTLIHQFPDHHQYYNVLAELYSRNQDYDQAILTYETVFTRAPERASELFSPLGRFVRQVPHHHQARKLLINICILICRPIDAVLHIKTLLSQSPVSQPYAVTILKNANEQYPDTIEILFLLADILIQSNDYSESVFFLTQIFSQYPSESEQILPLLETILSHVPQQLMALLLLGDIYYYQTQYSKSLSCYHDVIDCLPKDLDDILVRIQKLLSAPPPHQDTAHFLMAKITFLKKDYETATTYCYPILNTDHDLDARLILSTIYSLQHQFEKGLEILHPIREKMPHDWSLHQALLSLFQKACKHQLDEILSKPTETSSIPNPQQLQSSLLSGSYFMLSYRFHQAIEYFQKDHAPDRLVTRAHLLGRCFFEMGRFDLSNHQLELSLTSAKTQSPQTLNAIRYFMGINFICLGQYRHAIHLFDQVLQSDITTYNIKSTLDFYTQHNIVDFRGKAISGVFSSPFLSPEFYTLSVPNIENLSSHQKSTLHSMSFSYTHNNLGVDYVLQKNYHSAESEFKLAIQMDPNLTIAYCNLSYLMIIQQQFDVAHQLLKKAADINPKMDLIDLYYGVIKTLQSDYPNAQAHFQSALTLNPTNPVTLLYLGDIAYYTEDMTLALQYWKKASVSPHFFHLLQRRTRHLHFPTIDVDYWIQDYHSYFDI